MPSFPAELSGRTVCMATRRASLGHRDLAACPGSPEFDRPTGTVVTWARPLEVVQDVLRVVGGPQGDELVIGTGERPTGAARHETRVADFAEDHTQHPFYVHLPNVYQDAR